MKTNVLKSRFALLALVAAPTLLATSHNAAAQQLLLANPHWNITLSDFGYSDFLLDNTPGFEGREYLSGEWAAAVGYQAGGSPVGPQWLEPQFIFPDWSTLSTFHVVMPLTQTGLNADNLPIAEAVIANGHLEITLRHEMIDTVVGTPMGTTPASSTSTGTSISSDRYVLKQTCTIRNISGSPISNLQFFQFLHGLVSQRGLYDDRPYTGPLSQFRHDVTQAGVDTAAVSPGSSSAGLEDFVAFHASVAPSAFELGYYGVEGNGVDDHAIGKPSDGVHLSVEDNWQNPPYSIRQGTDEFTPTRRWVAGAQRWDLGNLAVGQAASIDVLLTLRTGTKVVTGPGSSGGCNGGSSVAGGLDYEFEDVSSDGSCFADYSQADETEMAVHIEAGDFDPPTFLTPGGPLQLWEVEFSGTYSGSIHLTFGYDPAILPPAFDHSDLCIFQFTGGTWQKLPSVVNSASHTVAVIAESLGAFALGVDSGTVATFNIAADVLPASSGTISGAGTYADGSSVTLVAAANAGYVFTAWTENSAVVSVSPSLTFIVHSNRTLTAAFAVAGAGRIITTSSLPSNGGSTSGGGEYAVGSSATVTATPNGGYKFSKWVDNGVVLSTSSSYTFTVSSSRALVAKFKPVYGIVVTADPPDGGEVEADPFYEGGELAVLKAKPNAGYSFVNWTQNGVPVSDDPIYQFNATANRELVGHFALGHRIGVSAEPANAGMATGGGVYPAGNSVFLEASANPGYVFVNWTENAAPVSTSPTYTFTSTANRVLVANFIAQPSLNSVLLPSGAVILSWPAGAHGWVLQETTSLSPANWIDSTRPVDIVGARKQVTISSVSGTGFFRLTH